MNGYADISFEISRLTSSRSSTRIMYERTRVPSFTPTGHSKIKWVIDCMSRGKYDQEHPDSKTMRRLHFSSSPSY